MNNKTLFLCLPIAASFSVQATAQVIPNAGSILQQAQPALPPMPSSTGTGLLIEQPGGAKLPPSAPFTVNAIQISGNTLFDTATLHALVADAEGKDLSLEQLGEAIDRITSYYRDHGYPLARAFVPAQTIREGMVRVEVIEARYGTITLDNRSRVNDALLHETLTPLRSGQPIQQGALDRALLLVSDMPGVAPSATLKPGETAGTSDLLVEAGAAPQLTANATADDYGNRYTGRARIGATLSYANPFRHGDVLSANALTAGPDMDYGRVSYETLLDGLGTRAGLAYSSMRYKLGDTLASLDGHGTAQVASTWIKQPLLRSRSANFYWQLQYDHQQLNDDIGFTGIRTDRHTDTWTASLSGDWHEAADSITGINAWNLSLTGGRLAFDNAAAQAADAATANTQGNFTKWTASLNRLQPFGSGYSLYATLAAQWANANLDASEKMTAGGPYTVRAYDMSVLSGDSGVLGSVELRRDMASLNRFLGGQSQAVVFLDSQHLTINRMAWSPAANSATLSGTGFGWNWANAEHWNAKAYVAKPIGASPAMAEANKSVRAWIEIGKGF